MKKLSSILLAALTLAATVSCNKENEQIVPVTPSKGTVLTAHADNGIVSKTTLDGVNVVWSSEDVITVFDAEGKPSNSTKTEILEGGSVAKFTVDPDAPLYAVYPAYGESDAVSMTGGKITATIPTDQAAINGSFGTGVNAEVAKISDKDNIQFKNVGGLVAVKVKRTTRTIKSIKIASDGDAYLMTGSLTVGFDEKGVVAVDEVTEGASYVELTGTIAAGETYYAVVAPGIYQGVTITFTDENGATATYTKKTDLDVERNSNQLIGGFDIPETKWQGGSKYYVKVTSDDDLVNGTYLIVYEGDDSHTSVAFNGGLEALDAGKNGVEVSISNDKILASSDLLAASFSIDIDEGSILSKSGYYIGVISYANALKQSETSDYSNAISIDNDGNAVISNTFTSGTMTLRYNNATGDNNLRFRYYKSGQQAIALYLLEGSGTASKNSPDLSFAETEYDATLGEVFNAPALTNPHSLEVVYSSGDETVATVNASTGEVALVAAGTTTITATFSGNDTYKAGSASYTLLVTAGSRTLASITAAENGISVKDVTVMAVSGSNVVIKDATGLFLMYKSDHGLAVGDLVDLTGDVTVYESNNILEFTANITITNKRTGTVDHGTATEFDSIAEELASAPVVSYVHAKGVQDDRNITTNEKNVLRLSAANAATDGMNVEVAGYTIGYSTQFSNHTIIATELGVDPDIAELSVDVDALTWLYNETSAKTVNVTVNANGGFTHSESNMDWATIAVNGNVITVTPNGENTNATANKGVITLTHTTDATKMVSISCEQSEFVNLVSATATFTGSASGGMTNAQTTQTGTRRNVTATISSGLADNSADHIRIYKNATLTLSVPSGAKITKVTFTTTSGYSISNLSNNTDGVWTGSAESVSFEASAQVRVNKIEVTYSIEESQLVKNSPVINASDVSIYVGDDGSIGASTDSDGAITYSIVSGSDYITLDETTGAITGVAEGTAVVKVSVAATANYSADSKNVNVTVNKKAEGGKTYSFTITTSDFNNKSYADNNNEKTATATATDGSGSTIDVKWTSNQVMLQGSAMQWQSGKGYIYNSTDLGTITEVDVTSSAGTFTTYYGTSAQPSSSTTVGGGFFQVKVGGATGKSTKITVTFTK